MGLFDEVLFTCPSCSAEIREQTKATAFPYLQKIQPEQMGSGICADLVYGEWEAGLGYIESDVEPFRCDCGIQLVLKTDVPKFGRCWLEVVAESEEKE